MRILIAEDDPVIGLALGQRLAALGHEPIGPASDGAQAIALAKAQRPDLYLFDIDMPVTDGLAAAAELTAQGLRRPVVVITGVDDPELIERSIATGVSAYLAKPINERELDAAIRLATVRHQEYRALEAEVSQARQALIDRKLVERAKAVLIEGLGIPEPEAFRRIQHATRSRNLKLADVARQVLENAALMQLPAPPKGPGGPDRRRQGRLRDG
jgi:response regulator NasT